MSLARAFTSKRSKRSDLSPLSPARSASTRQFSSADLRSKISSPVELVSTTNILSYTAPDIRSRSSSSSSSNDDYADSPATTPDSSSVASSPVATDNHLSSYFPSSSRSSQSSDGHRSQLSHDAVPAVPRRAPSHTRANHQIMARKRSISRMSPPPNSIAPEIRSSLSMFASGAGLDDSHPFSKELAQVNELAEEYGAPPFVDEEERFLRQKGLLKFGAEDYAMEIAGLFGGVFEDMLLPQSSGWI